MCCHIATLGRIRVAKRCPSKRPSAKCSVLIRNLFIQTIGIVVDNKRRMHRRPSLLFPPGVSVLPSILGCSLLLCCNAFAQDPPPRRVPLQEQSPAEPALQATKPVENRSSASGSPHEQVQPDSLLSVLPPKGTSVLVVCAASPAPCDTQPPDELPYEEGQPAPSGYHVEHRARKGLIIGGAVTFGVPYTVALAFAAEAESDRQPWNKWLALPIVGPFIALSARPKEVGYADAPRIADNLERAFLASDAIAQIIGVAVLTNGLISQYPVYARDVSSAKPTPPCASMALAPTSFGGKGLGLLLTGTTF